MGAAGGVRRRRWSTVVVHVVELAALLALLGLPVELVLDLLCDRPPREILRREPHRLAEGDVALSEVRESPFDHELVLLVVAQEVHPEGRLRAELLPQHLRVPAHDEPVLRPGEGHVEAARVVQEADPLVLVRSHAGEEDEVLLPALEAVDARDLDLLVGLVAERRLALEDGANVRPLPLVRRDDADLVRLDPGLEEVGDELLDVTRLRAVQVRGA
mmetsp:Transcript_4907/g.13793  ORF Transcript_4907/g.13793 Transcript_4907/m.13793 type:complete len:216 (-) Transcript_4907:1037-1684(-)